MKKDAMPSSSSVLLSAARDATFPDLPLLIQRREATQPIVIVIVILLIVIVIVALLRSRLFFPLDPREHPRGAATSPP